MTATSPPTSEAFEPAPDIWQDDLLWRQLKTIPAFRALLRAVEARFYQKIELPAPLLDVGCGDGHFAQMTFRQRIRAGIDPWWGPLNKARRSGMYASVLQATGDDLPFPDGAFASAFSNSVLEHIPDVQPVLDEVARVLQMNGRFVITAPSHYFTEYLGGAAFFERLGLDGMATSYRDFFNRISRHAHTDPPDVWAARLAQAGFVVERWQYYFSEGALRALELGHVQGLPSAMLHALTGHWILGPWESSLRPTERWVRPYYDEPFPDKGAYLLIIARKTADGPIDAPLPPARPFTPDELAAEEAIPGPDGRLPVAHEVVDEDSEVADAEETAVSPTPEPGAKLRRAPGAGWLTGALALLVLLFGILGQSALRAAPDQPGGGIGWLVLSGTVLLLLMWRSRGVDLPSLRLPSLRAIPQRRWLYLLGPLLAIVAQRFVAPGAAQRPWLALLLWLVAIGAAFYALDTRGVRTASRPTRPTLLIGLALFAAALVLRLFQLGSHPFILNGTEASLGLDAVQVLDGTLRNPFGAGWLTNPTLPTFLLALPLALLGQTVFALRLLSALVGALTVAAVFLIGERLYGRAVGLAAAVMLLGSHFHVHFSRLGLTNVWDGLLTLLALGLIALAWEAPIARKRRMWLLAGTAVGLNAYLYTSSHLLPLMLAALLMLTLLFERRTLWAQGRDVLAAALLALVVALPQMLYYQEAPGVFMERANTLGILSGQSGWLSNEVARTGQSALTLLQEQFWKAALAFNATLDQGTSYGALRPLLSFLPGVLFALGLIMALLRLRHLRYNILSVWVLVVIIFGGALLENPPNSHRLIIAAPALVLLAALALVELVGAVATLWRQPDESVETAPSSVWKTAVPLILTLVIAAGIALLDVTYYFGAYRSEHRFGDRNTEVAHEMASYLNTLDESWTAYFYGPPAMYVGFPTIPFLVTEFENGRNLFDVASPDASLPPPATPRQVHVFLPERQGELTAVQSRLPQGQLRIVDGYYAAPLFLAYEVAP